MGSRDRAKARSYSGPGLCSPSLSSVVADNPALIKLFSQIEDPRMSVKDLAFFLVTHDFDATPKKDFVEVRINDTIYKLVPNGKYSGLANMTLIS